MANKKKILICDDDQDFVRLLALRLGKEGFDLEVALDGMQVLQMARRTRPDAIVLDIEMPGGNGYDSLKKLSQNAQTLAIPVVIMSGKDLDASRVSEIHQSHFLKKPFEVTRLVGKLRQMTGLNNPEETPATEDVPIERSENQPL